MANKEIQGTTRLGGKTFRAGDEKALAKAAEEQGSVVRDRVYGVASTEVRGAAGGLKGGQRRAAELANSKGGKSGEDGEGDTDLAETSIADLPGVLAGMSDLEELKRAKRREKRVGAKAAIDARIQELKDEAAAGDGEGEE